MSDEHGSRPDFSWQDAFTSPSWQLPELDDAVLAPRLEDFGLTDFSAPRDLPRPPDVDQILRGEYTGWIPIIREGESLEQVQERQEVVPAPQVTQTAFQPSWLVVETFEYGSPSQANLQSDREPVEVTDVEDEFDDTFDTSAWSGVEPDTAMPQEHHTESIAGTLVAESTQTNDHSLELVIMRDEIQDLRNRLDASQKLVEEMMHKLADLAELALRSRK